MKSQIRVEIEKILGKEFNWVYIDACNKAKTKYRMKLCTRKEASIEQTKKIMSLPHVLNVGFWNPGSKFKNGHQVYPYEGITVYFDCKPSQIKF